MSPSNRGGPRAPYELAENALRLRRRPDLELIEAWDRLGFDEVWVGEHHSGGWS